MKQKKQKEGFLRVIRYIRCKFARNLLTDKGINRAGEGVLRAGYGNKMDF